MSWNQIAGSTSPWLGDDWETATLCHSVPSTTAGKMHDEVIGNENQTYLSGWLGQSFQNLV